MEKKYVFDNEQVKRKAGVVYRIRALVDIPLHNVKAGDFGGYIETEANLSHEGSAWVADEAVVKGRGQVSGDVLVKDYAILDNTSMSGNSIAEGEAHLMDSIIGGNSNVFSHQANVTNCVLKGENIQIVQEARLQNVQDGGYARSVIISGKAVLVNNNGTLKLIGKNVNILGNVQILDCPMIAGTRIFIADACSIMEGAILNGDNIHISGLVTVEGKIVIRDNVKLTDCVALSHTGSFQRKIADLSLSGDLITTVDELLANKTVR